MATAHKHTVRQFSTSKGSAAEAEPQSITLPEAVFSVPLDTHMLSQTIMLMRKNARAQTAHAKGRSEVRGGGRKPWRQKGTGRARHGSIRSPIWKGGGATHGPSKDRNYAVKINKKVRAKALAMVLSGKLRDDELILVDSLSLASHKTQQLAQNISTLFDETATGTVLLVPERAGVRLKRAARNIPDVSVKDAHTISALDLLLVRYLVLTPKAISVLEKRLS